MTRAEAIRQMAARGDSRAYIRKALGCTTAAIRSALKHTGDVGRPRVPRCEHCGQPIPAALAANAIR